MLCKTYFSFSTSSPQARNSQDPYAGVIPRLFPHFPQALLLPIFFKDPIRNLLKQQASRSDSTNWKVQSRVLRSRSKQNLLCGFQCT